MRNIFKRATSIIVVILMLIMSCVPAFAAVDLAGGLQQITQQVTVQAKAIFGIVFGLGTLIALSITVFKLAKYLLSFQDAGHQASAIPIIWAAIGTIVCGLATAGTFLGWFGL